MTRKTALSRSLFLSLPVLCEAKLYVFFVGMLFSILFSRSFHAYAFAPVQSKHTNIGMYIPMGMLCLCLVLLRCACGEERVRRGGGACAHGNWKIINFFSLPEQIH